MKIQPAGFEERAEAPGERRITLNAATATRDPSTSSRKKVTHRILRPQGSGRFVFLCDHGGNRIPAEFQNLGLPKSELTRHIAWDIGAAGVTETLSAIFDAPAILTTVSRLVIDCNRHPDAPDLVPEVSDGTIIPGNLNLSDGARTDRLNKWFRPYHSAIERILGEREGRAVHTVFVSVHSMTARLAGQPRPWQIAISSHRDRSFADPVLAALRQPGDVVVGDNQPYDLDPAVDYSTPFHAMRREIPHVQVEFRQDEIADEVGQQRWALLFAEALTARCMSS
jgi:predicted N-formylglutamate amidohydrolase